MFALLQPLILIIVIILAGAACHSWLSGRVEQWLNQYVYYLAFPTILFMSFSQVPLADIVNWPFILGYGAALLSVFLLIFVKARRQGYGNAARLQNISNAALRALATTFGNTAFIGIPVLTALYPGSSEALLCAALATMMSVMMFSIALLLVRLSSQIRPRHQQIILVLKILAKNPILIGCVAGILASALSWKSESTLNNLLWFIGYSASPLALFAVGIALATTFRLVKDTRQPIWPLLATKHLLLPLLVWIGMSVLNVDTQLTAMATLLGAMPTAASVYLLAYQENANPGLMAKIIVSGTCLSLILLPLQAWLLGMI